MQTCYNCGKQVDDNVLICPDCGALVRRYGRPEPNQPQEPIADLAWQPEPTPASRKRPRRFTTGTRVWLTLCIIVGCFQLLTYFNLFYLYANQSYLPLVFEQFPELSYVSDFLSLMLQSIRLYLWFYILAAALYLMKLAGLIWFAASGRRRAFFMTATVAGLIFILSIITGGLMQAILPAADLPILYLFLRKTWHTLPL